MGGEGYIYGAGIRGRRVARIFSQINWTAYIDKKEIGMCNGIPIIRLDELHYKEGDFIVISNEYHSGEIKSQLLEYGVPESEIIILNNYDEAMAQMQYKERFIETNKGVTVSIDADDGQKALMDMKKMSETIDVTVGCIELDVEGWEKTVLDAGLSMISRFKPNLAISLYHKKEDVWEIPLLLLEINKNYKFYLRHYSVGVVETILYAIDEEKDRFNYI